MASTLAMASAVSGWIAGSTAARSAQSSSTAPAGATTTGETTASTTTTAASTTTTAAAATTTASTTTTAAATTTTGATTTSETTTAAGATIPPPQSIKARPRHKRPRRGSSASTEASAHGTTATPATSGSPAVAEASTASVTTDVWSQGLGVDATALGPLGQLIGNGDLPPSYLIPIYKAAGRQYHIPWEVLAAINGIETDYGRNLNTSSAGAVGWMQFMPATWSEYAVPVAGQGKPSPYDPRAAIFAAAHLLAANGGEHHLRHAIFAYNHASWYVDSVLWREKLISDSAAKDQRTSSLGYALPLDSKYMRQLGRTDEGVDIETAPDGAAVYSITSGVVTAVASDPTGFGPDYPVIRVTNGPLAGNYIYYGHVAASLVHVGQRVKSGQPVAVIGHAGDAASLGHGHIEIGFSDASGDPLNHPGTVATASGSAMRSFLIELSGASGIHNS